jgi:UDP-2-acetamido-2-deoxy-ribo-hexuluronate aminotransferase
VGKDTSLPDGKRSIKLVDLFGQYQRIKPEIDEAVASVLVSTQFILGKEVGEFESAAVSYLGTKYAIGCASGTDALQVAMMALGIGVGDEVITSPFTFVATAETIALLGATPAYVDIDPMTYNIDSSKIERAITGRTKAIIPIHLYGQPADMDPIMEVAHRHGLKVIEDAAQAFGAEYKGRKVGGFGDIACFSFFPSKNLGAFGDAGMLTTNDEQLAERMRMISLHGSRKKYQHEIVGINSRLDTLQAAVLKVKIKYVDAWNRSRQNFAARYSRELKDSGVITPYVMPGCTHIYHQYSIRLPKSSGKTRDALVAYLKSRDVPTAVHYPIPLHLQKAFAHLGKGEGEYPFSETVASEILSLPMHTELDEGQIEYIVRQISEFLGQ